MLENAAMPSRFACSTVAVVISAVLFSTAGAAWGETEYQKETKWNTNYEQALALAKKENRVILVYFCGSDWDPWTQKLDHDVMDTDMFRNWAAANVVLMKVDILKEKHQGILIKAQNDKLRQQFSVSKVPIFIFLDSAGLPFARAGWDEAKLRDDERIGAPGRGSSSWMRPSRASPRMSRSSRKKPLMREWPMGESILYRCSC